VTYGPRGSNVGGSPRGRDGGAIQAPGEHQKYAQSVAEQQENYPRFNSSGQRVMRHSQTESNTSGRPSGNNGAVINNTPVQENQGRRNSRNRNSDVIIQRQDNQPSRRSEQPVFNPGGDYGGGRNSGGGGGTSPRNSGGGGSPRHR
jgi:hypothetical protein